MSIKKQAIARFRLDAITNLPEQVWAEIDEYSGEEWELPQKSESLESIIGKAKTKDLYAINNSAECNVQLREALSPHLKSSNKQVRLSAIEWVVYDWGHVRGKSEKHEKWPEQLKNFEPNVVNDFISANYQNRIASWSKVLGFTDSRKYAIYDARVAMSLNAILDNTSYKYRFYMPPPSSTKLSSLFSNIKNHVAGHYVGKQPTYLGYFDYMDLLNAFVEKGLVPNVLEAEMRLFAHGMTFAKQYAAKHNLPYQD
jgi:hypothetical protein